MPICARPAPRRPAIPREGPSPLPPPQIAHAPCLPAPPVPGAAQSDGAAPLAPEHPALPHNGDDTPIGARLQAALARIVPAIEAMVARLGAGPVHAHEIERVARALTAFTRILRELKALAGQYPAPVDDDRGPEDPDEFLRDMARRMDAFAAADAAAAVIHGGDPEFA